MTTPCRHEPELVAGLPVVYREEQWMAAGYYEWLAIDEHHVCRHCGARMEIPTEKKVDA